MERGSSNESSDGPRLDVWCHLWRVLAALIRDVDAVLRAQLGGPAMHLRAAPGSDSAADLWIGSVRLRFVLEEPTEPPPFALSASPQALYLRVLTPSGRRESGGATAGLWIDPTNRRWLPSANPSQAYALDDETALDDFFLSLIAA